MSKGQKLLMVGVAISVALFVVLDGGQYLTLEYIKSQQMGLQQQFADAPLLTLSAFFAVYVVVTALSFPGAALLTLLAGAIFGVLWGTLVVSLASTLGATLAFMGSRFLFKAAVQRRFGTRLQRFNDGVERDGAFYLFTLRLVPVVPFFMINLGMGLTPIRTWTFVWVSQLGMLAGTAVYVNAGTQLGQIDSLAGILSPALLASFALLGLFPLLAKKVVGVVQQRKIYRGFQKPARFDRNLVVIGGGSAGLVTSYIAAAVKAKVTLIEKHKMGGDCLNTGCVPSKALIRSAKFVAEQNKAAQYGMKSASVEFDFAEVMERVQRVVKEIEPHDSVERYTDLGVEVIEGAARITSPWSVVVNGQTLTTRNIVIATGARPLVPPIPGLEQIDYLTSDNLWQLRELPERLLVLGGGPIGCELTQSFARFGSQVTQVEMAPRLMVREDVEISAYVEQKFRSEGVDLRTGHRALRFERQGSEQRLICAADDGDGAMREVAIPFDKVLVAVGRSANISGFGLEELGVPTTERGTLAVNEYLQAHYPNIYACGDVAGPYQFTHTAAHQAWYTAVNALFGLVKRFKVDYRVIPWATFTDPEVARVGLNEQEAKEQGIAYEVTTFELEELDRAIADGTNQGLVKVLTVPGKDKILGVTIMGSGAGELIAEYVSAMKHGLGLNKVLGTIHIYPTMAEANKYVAGNWKRAHAPKALLSWVERFHNWRRGEGFAAPNDDPKRSSTQAGEAVNP